MHIERVSETKNPDLIGKKFGKLTVVEYAGNNKFKCACDCGGTCEVNTFSLKSGHTRSCGCLERNSKDLSGQKFGRLTVLYRDVDYVLPNGAKRQTYRCACDCGEECIVLKQHLVSGNTKSCGCLSKDVSSLKGRGHVDISGQKFGKLTTLEYCGDGKWLCVCDCGNLCNVKTADLRGHNTRSCGCLISEKALYNIKKHGEEAPKRKIRAEYGLLSKMKNRRK